jgi:hypothetical protein
MQVFELQSWDDCSSASVHHKSHMECPGIEPDSYSVEAMHATWQGRWRRE